MLVGVYGTEEDWENGSMDGVDEREPPESYDNLLKTVAYAAPRTVELRDTPWTRRIFERDEIREGNFVMSSNVLQRRTKYKPVD